MSRNRAIENTPFLSYSIDGPVWGPAGMLAAFGIAINTVGSTPQAEKFGADLFEAGLIWLVGSLFLVTLGKALTKDNSVTA
jgi:hypothetical protein